MGFPLRGIWLAVLLTAGACSTPGEVQLTGWFTDEAPPASEVRIMLDPHHNHRSCNHDEESAASLVDAASGYQRVYPGKDRRFTSEPIPVEISGAAKPPTFFLSFVNEKDVIYAVGELYAALAYRTYDAETKADISRAEVCWKLVRAGYLEEPENRTVLSILIAPNFDSPKQCLPAGTFTPRGLETLDTMPE